MKECIVSRKSQVILAIILINSIILFASETLARQDAPILPILVYHQIRTAGTDPADGPTAISLEKFKSQMQYLHDSGYTTLSMDEVVKFLDGKPFPPNIVAIHFDDGWQSALSAVPVLEELKFKATFWIIVGKGISWPHMEWDEIKALARNPRFGIFSHTMTHPWKENDTLLDWVNNTVPGKGIEQINWELTESRLVLEKQLGRKVPYLAWPKGLYNNTLIALAQQAGYSSLLTIDDGFNHIGDSHLRIHRTMVDGACDNDVFRKILLNGKFYNCSFKPIANSNTGTK
jgi:peptidoglycan/xylan/chitin deacetylase (PgdA/CDA1 family)